MISGTAYAIAGHCANCHTMHNSQNGTIMADRVQPYDYLLRASCLGCHTSASGPTSSFGAPAVLHTTEPTDQGPSYTLAGGDFYWVGDSYGNTDSEGHNVDLVASVDAAISAELGNNPPGWDTDYNDDAFGDPVAENNASWPVQLTCAGAYGCHGDHGVSGNDAGIAGAHHGNTGGTRTQADGATTVGASYRFCAGINGLEDTSWEWSADSSDHNEYFGSDYNDTGGSPAEDDLRTISYLCALCHGQFHKSSDIGGTTSPWLRHPTDIVLPNTAGKEYSDYNPDNSNLYSIEAPVARPTVPASSSSTVTPDTDIVMCLSCHRAHGSPEPDILRWTYSGIVAGSGTTDDGCFTCHTTKNAD